MVYDFLSNICSNTTILVVEQSNKDNKKLIVPFIFAMIINVTEGRLRSRGS